MGVTTPVNAWHASSAKAQAGTSVFAHAGPIPSRVNLRTRDVVAISIADRRSRRSTTSCSAESG